MKQKKAIKNWWIDLIMLVGYLFCFYLEFTGINYHQWLGAGITLLAILHLWLHLDWVITVTRRFFDNTSAQNRRYYLVDLLLIFGFVVIIETGIVISTWLNLDLFTYSAWLDVHIIASVVTLFLLVLKIGLHWKWVIAITRRIFGASGQPAVQGTLAPARVPVSVGQGGIARRHFLGMMGVVGLGSLLAVINLVTENQPQQVNALADGTDDFIRIEAQTTSQTPPITTDPEEMSSVETATTETVASAEDSQVATTQLPQETPAAVAACQVRCSKSCTFPGRCRRYTDQNNNGLCDLGECM